MAKRIFLITVTVAIAFIAIVLFLAFTQENNVETMLAIETTGGLCPYGGCYGRIVINNDGSYTYAEGSGKVSKGQLAISDAEDLGNLVKNADFNSIKSQEFTGTCPTAFDGSMLTYTFYPSEEIISSCTYGIDADAPLFKLIARMLSTIYSEVQ